MKLRILPHSQNLRMKIEFSHLKSILAFIIYYLHSLKIKEKKYHFKIFTIIKKKWTAFNARSQSVHFFNPRTLLSTKFLYREWTDEQPWYNFKAIDIIQVHFTLLHLIAITNVSNYCFLVLIKLTCFKSKSWIVVKLCCAKSKRWIRTKVFFFLLCFSKEWLSVVASRKQL